MTPPRSCSRADVQDALRALQSGLSAAKRELAAERTESEPQTAAESQPSIGTFTKVLGTFLEEAETELEELKETSAETERVAREALDWLGVGRTQEATAVFELLNRFVMLFDASYTAVHRLASQKAVKRAPVA